MKPNFRIEADGKDLTDKLRSRLLRLSVQDNQSSSSDTLALELSDFPSILWPDTKLTLAVALGYDNDLTDLGRFTIQHIAKSSTPESILKIEASSLEKFSSLKNQKEILWTAISLGELTQQIAKHRNLKPSIASEIFGILLQNEVQTESDLGFLTRLARRYHLNLKISGRTLYLCPIDMNKTKRRQIQNPLRFEYSGELQSPYTGVRAYWYDSDSAKRQQVLYGKEGIVYELEFNRNSAEAAQAAAEAKFKSISKKTKTLRFSIPGLSSLAVEESLIIKDFGPGIDGLWQIESIEHVLDSNGFISNVSCQPA